MKRLAINRLITAAQSDAKRFDKQYNTHTFSNHVENIGWAEGWADGREAPQGIAYANWNEIGGYRDNRYSERARTLMKRLCDALERVGVEIEWSDQVSMCDDCGLLIQTEPDCYPYAMVRTRRAFVLVVGKLWSGPTGATQYELTDSDLESIGPRWSRLAVRSWLAMHAGDFRVVEDFYAVCGDYKVKWQKEESECLYNDCMYPEE